MHQLSNLHQRILSALVLVPVALLALWCGGWVFAALCLLTAILVFWEWWTITSSDHSPINIGAGGLYALLPCLALIALRGNTGEGFWQILLLFVVVWTTDIAAYFSGRTLGGPKLAPSISPAKTWSGAIGGALGAIILAMVTASFAGMKISLLFILTVLTLSIASQIGDLFESAFKRRYGVKDSSQIIPGHGGVMDRVDGLVSAAVLLLLISLVINGWDGLDSAMYAL